MKKIKAIILLAVLSVISALNANAQSSMAGPDAGGLWCIVDVDLKFDPTDSGYAYYIIDTPLPVGAEINISGGREILCMGPGRPRLVEKDGNTCLKIYLAELEMEIFGAEYGTLYVDVNTDTMVDVMTWYDRGTGSYWTQVPKYYTIQLNIKNTEWNARD